MTSFASVYCDAKPSKRRGVRDTEGPVGRLPFNLYADQLNRGFRGLRFLPELERDYRRYMLEDSFALKRIALSVGMLVWLAFIGIDLLILAGPHCGAYWRCALACWSCYWSAAA